jgi:hypothetical protein
MLLGAKISLLNIPCAEMLTEYIRLSEMDILALA